MNGKPALATIATAVTNGREYAARAEVIPAVPARYNQMADLIQQARAYYVQGAAAAGLPIDGLVEITSLGRITRAWIDGLHDTSIVAVAIGAGFPAHLAPMVSIGALRAWLTMPAYGGDDPKLTHILDTAAKRYAEAYPDLATACPDCGAEPGEEDHLDCLAEASLDDKVTEAFEAALRDDLPDSWCDLPADALRAVIGEKVRMEALEQAAAGA
ncbi:hypothetical protein [Planomonospora algeriensis]